MNHLDVMVVGETNQNDLTGSYARAFRSLGLSVEVFDYYGRVKPTKVPNIEIVRQLGTLLVPATHRPIAEVELLKELSEHKPRLLFFVKTDDLHRTFYRAAKLVSKNTIIAAFHPDNPFNVGTFFRPGSAHPRSIVQLRSVDHYFIWSNQVVESARKMGIKNIHYLPFGSDAQVHMPLELTESEKELYSADISFVGTWDEKREAWLSPLSKTGLRLAIWACDYWKTRCKSEFLTAAWQGRPARGTEFAKVIAGSMISVNLLRHQNEGAHNMRTFEVPACRGALISEWSEDQTNHFEPGKEMLFFKTPEDLATQVVMACKDPKALNSMRSAAYTRALKEHPYVNRAREIIRRVGIADS